MDWALAVAAASLLLVAAFSRLLTGTPVTAAMVFVALGVLLGPRALDEIDVSSADGQAIVRALSKTCDVFVDKAHAGKMTLLDEQRAEREGLAHREPAESLASAEIQEHPRIRRDETHVRRHRDLKLIDFDWSDVFIIRLHDDHRQARDAHIEVGHRRSVDDAEADALTGLEQAGPIFFRSVAVDEVSVGRAGDVRDVTRVHAHPRPHPAF